MSATVIEVSERITDYWNDCDGVRRPKYHAQILDKPGLWACGKSIDEAIGDLVRTHPDQFGVQVSWLGKKAR